MAAGSSFEGPSEIRTEEDANSREELLEALRATLAEAIAFNRQEAISAAGKGYEELSIAV